MPTYIKTGFWDKKAKAPDGWLDLNQFVQTLIPPPPPSTNIYNSDGTLTGNRIINGDGFSILFNNLQRFDIVGTNFASTLAIDDANGDFLVSANYIQFFTPDINFEINNINNILKTAYQGNDIGLKLDFANQIYGLGDFSLSVAGTQFIVKMQIKLFIQNLVVI